MVGAGQIALSSVEQLRAIGQVSPELLDALIAYLADGNEWAAERLAREPGWVLDAALRETATARCSPLISARSTATSSPGSGSARRPKRCYERAVELTRQLDRYSYGGATVRFSEPRGRPGPRRRRGRSSSTAATR